MSVEIKTCPFCGGKAKLEKNVEGYTIICTECGASTGTSYQYDENDTIKDWNSRYFGFRFKPCPCCGGIAKLDSVVCQGTKYYALRCENCYVGFKAYTNAKELVKAWNTRTETGE